MPTPITVTATLTDPSSTALQGNAFVRFRLRNYQGYVPRVSGTAIVAETQIDSFPNGSGQISQTLWKNTDITPGTTFWTVEFWNQGRPVSSGNYQFNGNTDLDTAAQMNTPPVPAGFSLVLENNGALNSSQSTLNLANDDGTIGIVDLGGGTLRLRGAPTSQFAVAGKGWFAGPGMTDASSIFQNSASEPITNYNPNVVVVSQFVLQAAWTLSSCSYQVITTGGAGAKFAFGIYDSNGNLLQSCTFDGTISTLQTVAFSLTLPQGVYYFAFSASDATIKGPAIQAGSVPLQLLAALNAVHPLYATAANAMSAGVLPATLGALTAASVVNWESVPLPIWAV